MAKSICLRNKYGFLARIVRFVSMIWWNTRWSMLGFSFDYFKFTKAEKIEIFAEFISYFSRISFWTFREFGLKFFAEFVSPRQMPRGFVLHSMKTMNRCYSLWFALQNANRKNNACYGDQTIKPLLDCSFNLMCCETELSNNLNVINYGDCEWIFTVCSR